MHTVHGEIGETARGLYLESILKSTDEAVWAAAVGQWRKGSDELT